MAQRWPSRHSPPTPSALAHAVSNDDELAQEIDFPTSSTTMTNMASSSSQYRSAPSTPVPREDARLLPSTSTSPPNNSEFVMGGQRPTRSASATSFAPSPLNPSGSGSGANLTSSTSSASTSNPFASRPQSRSSTNKFSTYSAPLSPSASHHPDVMTTLGLGAGPHTSAFPQQGLGSRGSMVLYRLATADDASKAPATSALPSSSGLLPPRLFGGHNSNRDSVASSSGDSIISLDSKYPTMPWSGPTGAGPSASAPPSNSGSVRGFVPYAYNPLEDDEGDDEMDMLHDPRVDEVHLKTVGSKEGKKGYGAAAYMRNGGPTNTFPWRGVVNVGVLVLLILALLSLFIFYPVLSFFRDEKRNEEIVGNIRVNATGQAPLLFQMPEMIDPETPKSARTRTGFDNQEYELVFSDEFNTDGRTFYPGDDPFWEAVDLWYGATADLEWYDPQQVTTRGGALVITIDSINTTQSGLTPGSTAPFTIDNNHGLGYRSGMLQTWNKFCFTTGYIEVAVTFPGPDQQTTGYWPGAWTMGNLARPGYPATTDGMWPYTYDSCDLGTFPNQTLKDGSGPAAALHSDASRSKNNFELSWLSGQRTSACSCPGSDHPGPSVSRGRGAPEIDIFEAEKDKNFDIGQVVSQSSQFGPFMHDYLYWNDSGQWSNLDPSITRANTFRGSSAQQSISALTRLPSDMFQGSGANYATLGFEYWSDPNDREAGYITWQVAGQPTHRVLASAVGPDPLPNGTGVGQRLISEEPMSIVLNLGISANWQPILPDTMTFPGEMKFDYVRVYQRKGQTNTGCNPSNYPTADYINNHLAAYTDVNMTTWQWEKPKNSLYDGC